MLPSTKPLLRIRYAHLDQSVKSISQSANQAVNLAVLHAEAISQVTTPLLELSNPFVASRGSVHCMCKL